MTTGVQSSRDYIARPAIEGARCAHGVPAAEACERCASAKKDNWIRDELPDADMLVCIRCHSQEYPIASGFHDGENWRTEEGAVLEKGVRGWMDLEDAARILDAGAMWRDVA